MSENIFALEHQANQKRKEARAEVRRDRIGSDLARVARQGQRPRWQRMAPFFAALFSFRQADSTPEDLPDQAVAPDEGSTVTI